MPNIVETEWVADELFLCRHLGTPSILETVAREYEMAANFVQRILVSTAVWFVEFKYEAIQVKLCLASCERF